MFRVKKRLSSLGAEMRDGGADILDIGGESTRPGSLALDLQQELDRTIPLIREIRELSDIPISIDTNKSTVMRAAAWCESPPPTSNLMERSAPMAAADTPCLVGR